MPPWVHTLLTNCLRHAALEADRWPASNCNIVLQVHLDKHLKLLDSPGIVFSASASTAASALRNCVKVALLCSDKRPQAARLVQMTVHHTALCSESRYRESDLVLTFSQAD